MDPALLDDVDGFIAALREDAGAELVPSRVEAESEARQFLDTHAGSMSAEQAVELGRILNRGFWGGSMKHNRFLPGLSPPLMARMTKDIDSFNRIVERLWRGTEEESLEAADEVFRDSSVLPGSGRSFPSILLYLKDPARFPIWFNSLDKGLAVLTDYASLDRSGGVDSYQEFAEAARAFAKAHEIIPQELDAVLSSAHRWATKRRAAVRSSAAEPILGRAAFGFLADLAANNSKEWMDANRERYERELRDPLARVLEAIAEDYVVGLDPQINAVVKRDEVLARIYKWSRGEPYYTYLWGAFSRDKKQEDVQLYVNIDADRLHFGLYLGSANPELIERFVAEARAGESGVSALLSRLPSDLEWDHDGDPVRVETVDDLVAWAQGPGPHARFNVHPESPLIESTDLVSTIGELFVDLHPLAAMAWGDDVEIESISAEESARPGYSFDQLVADTLLPEDTLREWIDLLTEPDGKQAALFYGPPGTGKTYVAQRLARHLAGTDGAVQMVQFHPSFSYEDFIEGLRPVMKDGQLGYEVRPGVFYEFCEQARGKDGTYVFVIDEINRAELGAVLGEVMMLIEYRDRALPLPYSQRSFSIPRNVVLLATMNTADRSLALVDFALRRRFHAFRMLPDRDVLAAWTGEDSNLALGMFDLVRKSVASDDYAPGQTYWMGVDGSPESLERLWRYELRPYLSEYWFEHPDRLDQLEVEVLTLLSEGA